MVMISSKADSILCTPYLAHSLRGPAAIMLLFDALHESHVQSFAEEKGLKCRVNFSRNVTTG